MDPATFLEDLFEIRFKLTLPGEIGDNNADVVEGNTLIWNVGLSDEGGTYEAVSSTGGSNSALLYAGIGVAALVVVGVGVTAMRRRKETAAVEAVTSAPISTEAPPFDPID
jgi:LPXTG-motif cell wall-anchored protein